MYSINRDTNQITPLQKHSFKDLRFREREHLQEWLAKHPEALGDLLIIQKEFDGFNNTRERLDLLALDRQGRIVVIENKLDDSGRDVIWQALKYAAYCSTLKTDQIVEIYSRYLGQPADAAREAITDFTSSGDSEELSLNTANSQRIIFVAASFRPEITATALWLLGKGVSITCFQVSPFSSGDDLFLTVDQIIPPPEASDYMIQLAEKSAVEETANSSRSKSYDRRQQYWKALFARFEEAGLSHLQGRVPAPADAWISIKSGSSAFFYSLNVLKQEVRLQVNIESPNADRNSEVFEFLKTRKATIEAEYGSALVWYNPPNAKVCRIIDSYQIDTTDQSNWPDAIEWQQKRLDSILAAFSPYIDEIAAL